MSVAPIKIVRKGAYLPPTFMRVYCGRPGVLGNPFSHLASGTLAQHRVVTRAEAVARFGTWLDSLPDTSEQWQAIEELRAQWLAGQALGLECWCGEDPPAGHCHTTIIADRIKAETWDAALEREESNPSK